MPFCLDAASCFPRCSAKSKCVTKKILFCPYVGVWDKILEPVACVRKKSEMLQLFPAYLKGEDLFGLTVSAVARIAESVSARAHVTWGHCPLARLSTEPLGSRPFRVVALPETNSCLLKKSRPPGVGRPHECLCSPGLGGPAGGGCAHPAPGVLGSVPEDRWVSGAHLL